MTDDDIRVLIDDPTRRAEVSVAELADALLARLETRADLHAMITLTPELALAQAVPPTRRAHAVGRCHSTGCRSFSRTTSASQAFRRLSAHGCSADRVASSDAEVATRIRAAGGVILGKANLHELAFGATSANVTFGAVVNPAAPDRIPGGSSGGSGAAVAADLCIAAIGTDTGGSVRLPASLCGVSGLRPTFGAVSNHGVQPVSVSMDTVGPLARSVADLRGLLAPIAGFDSRDPASCDQVLGLTGDDSVKGLRVGVVESLVERSDQDVAAAVRAVADVLRESGAQLSPIAIDGWERAVDACGLLIKAEALDVYRDAVAETPELFEEGTRRRLALAADVDDDALRALRVEQSRFAETVECRAWASCCCSRRSPSTASGGRSGHGRHVRRRCPVHAPAELRPPARPVDSVRRDLVRRAGRRAARGCAVARRSRPPRRGCGAGGDRLAPRATCVRLITTGHRAVAGSRPSRGGIDAHHLVRGQRELQLPVGACCFRARAERRRIGRRLRGGRLVQPAQ